ncbi:MAG: putative transrane protein [Hydrocarboniphaga sp.]|uniref:metallophosphoesterase n=1 Tax=Hydrocarboniphaga sp. TaxID=2033016 RepID=UPI002637677C|nr:metallophosphoesterase [Hydrocarboniphaga sp.]MDB5968841.1 putative transrane protein [Hydrocarboniphaga sp.]
MKRILTAVLLFASAASAYAAQPAGTQNEARSKRPITIAVFGDWPYNQLLLDNAPLLINSINSDKAVSQVVHVGDIHSGSMACTSAGILPPITTSNPGWNQTIYYQFQQFNDPFVYTPGDNEWTDCHKSKQFSSGAPLKELASVRSLFFAKAGSTLGQHEKQVLSQAKHYDPAYPSDAHYVENVMWEDNDVVFATFNMPGGSNNDTVPWTGIFADPAAQSQEVAERSAADMHWLQYSFDRAIADHASAVVVILQANMWDPEATASGGAGLDQYTPFVQELADLSVSFGRPVLLLNGDTHVYEEDQPLADPTSTTGMIHDTQPVPNLTRITVQGSTTAPSEWLRLTIDPRSADVFSWTNVPYCTDPLTSCQ